MLKSEWKERLQLQIYAFFAIAPAIKDRNSSTFYFRAVAPSDWTLPQNDALWRDMVKTLFDPCPEGWRVARSGAGRLSPWSDFGTLPYATPFYYYINGVKQTAAGVPAFVAHPNNGRRYDRENGTPTVWYPSPGYRDFGRVGYEGVLRNVGYNGYSWSSTVSGSYGMGLSFGSSWLSPSGANVRGHGFPLRCIRE